MDECEQEKDPRAAVDAMTGKRKGKERESAAAIVDSEVEFSSEARLLLGSGRSGENAECNSRDRDIVIEKKKEEEEGVVSEGSFEAMIQHESVIESGPLPSLQANKSISDGLTNPPRAINENSSSIWHTLSMWWKKDKRTKHTIDWAKIEIDVCPPPDFVEESWELSAPDFIEEPWQETPPEHHEPELEAPPSPINDYGWFTLPTWWRKEKRAKRTITPADIDECPPPGYTEESGIFWAPEHESDLATTESINGSLDTEARGGSGRTD